MSAGNGNRRRDWILSPDPLTPRGRRVLSVGVLALQGDFREHRSCSSASARAPARCVSVADLRASTASSSPAARARRSSKLMDAYGLVEADPRLRGAGGPIYGTCAGLITLARDTVEGTPPTLGLMDIVARRNAFGRQVHSFEADLDARRLGASRCMPCSSARRGSRRAGPGVAGAGQLQGHIVAAARGRRAGRPRSTRSSPTTRALHEHFLEMVPAGGAPHRSDRRDGASAIARGGGVLVSGHSKWATIKHKKGKEDAKRGKLFTKLSRAITVAAREGGADPDMNAALANAIEKAKSYSMPKDNIERAIQRGGGGAGGAAYERIVYEGYGPAGVAIIVEVLTDNRNRSAAEVRNIFSKHGGAAGAARRRGLGVRAARLASSSTPRKYGEDDVMAAAIDAGADDVVHDGESVRGAHASRPTSAAVRDAIIAAGIEYRAGGAHDGAQEHACSSKRTTRARP